MDLGAFYDLANKADRSYQIHYIDNIGFLYQYYGDLGSAACNPARQLEVSPKLRFLTFSTLVENICRSF